MGIDRHQRIGLLLSEQDIDVRAEELARAFKLAGWKWHGRRGQPGYNPEPAELAEAIRDIRQQIGRNEGMMGLGGVSLQMEQGKLHLAAAPEIADALATLQPEDKVPA